MEVEQREWEGAGLCGRCYFTPEDRKGLLRTRELPGEPDQDDENLGGKEKMQKPGARSMPGVFWEQEHVWRGWRRWRQRVAGEKSRDVVGGES